MSKRRLTFSDGYKNYCYDPIDIMGNDYSNINFQKIVDKLAEYEDNNEWIPFTFEYDKELKKEILNCQLPDEDEEILVSDGHHVWLDIFMRDYDECYLESNDDFKGLAWMPLPEPYKGE